MKRRPESLRLVVAVLLACSPAGTELELVDYGATTAPGTTLALQLTRAGDTVDVAEAEFGGAGIPRTTPPIRLPGEGPVRVTATLLAGASDTIAQTGLTLIATQRRVAIVLRPSGADPAPCSETVSTALVTLPADTTQTVILYLCPMDPGSN